MDNDDVCCGTWRVNNAEPKTHKKVTSICS